MPQWDYKCDTCGRVETRWFATHQEMIDREQSTTPCKPNPTKKCAGKLVRQASAPAFSVKGYSAENGYSNKGVQ